MLPDILVPYKHYPEETISVEMQYHNMNTLGWKRIECTEPVAPDSEERRMRTIESINDEILKELEKVL